MLNQVGIKKIKEEEHNFIVHVLFSVVTKLDMQKKTDKLELEEKLEKEGKQRESQKTN